MPALFELESVLANQSNKSATQTIHKGCLVSRFIPLLRKTPLSESRDTDRAHTPTPFPGTRYSGSHEKQTNRAASQQTDEEEPAVFFFAE